MVTDSRRRFGTGSGPWWIVSSLIAVAIGAGALLAAGGRHDIAQWVWAVATVAALVPLVLRVVPDLLLRRPGVDVIAVLSMGGALALRENLAGAVLGLMLATGRLLERFAEGRAERELSALLERAPRRAHRMVDGHPEEIPIENVAAEDVLLVREGDLVPVDGVVVDASAWLDESALTGEAGPVERAPGDRVASGTSNAGAPFRMRATARSAESTYAGIVRLVERARTTKAPMTRLADRWALAFIPLTLAVAAGAWAWTRDPVRALAVLVVATPCPLLIAVPIAILGGISRLARRGVIVKGGAALETLARADILFLDKTGTVTAGSPRVSRIVALSETVDANELLRLAASSDRASSHVFAAALVRAAGSRGLALSVATDAREERGSGVEARVDGHVVRVGRLDWTAESEAREEFGRRLLRGGGSVVFVSIDGRLAGAILLEDPIRVETPRALRALRRLGVRDIVVLTGDHEAVAASVAGALGVDRVLAEQSPEAKQEVVRAAHGGGVTVMVGDGINDAAALAAADVGVALGARGATVASEAADVVIVTDRFDRIVDALEVAKRTRAVALESVAIGMGLSLVAMAAAAGGLLAPAVGAILQEGIDVLAILSGLRAAGPGRRERARARVMGILPPAQVDALHAEHGRLTPFIDRLRDVADGLDRMNPEARAAALADVRHILEFELVSHERADDAVLYPLLERRLPGDDPLAALSRTHQEIFRLARQLELRLAEDAAASLDAYELGDVRRLLYALHALLGLHFAQEGELYQSVSDDAQPHAGPVPRVRTTT